MCSVAKSYLTLCKPMDYSLPGAFVHGILQVRILEWVAIFSSGGYDPEILTQGSSLCLSLLSSSSVTSPPWKSFTLVELHILFFLNTCWACQTLHLGSTCTSSIEILSIFQNVTQHHTPHKPCCDSHGM